MTCHCLLRHCCVIAAILKLFFLCHLHDLSTKHKSAALEEPCNAVSEYFGSSLLAFLYHKGRSDLQSWLRTVTYRFAFIAGLCVAGWLLGMPVAEFSSAVSK